MPGTGLGRSAVDAWIVEHVQQLRGAPFDDVFRTLSNLALLQAAALAVLVAIIAQRRTAWPAIVAIVAVATTSVTTAALKSLVGRVRPPLALSDVQALVPVPHDASFPSGHASSAFAAAVVLGAYAPRLRVALLVVATLVSISRVWLGVHYPSDVVAGAAVGSAIAWLAVRGVERLRETRGPAT